MSRRERYAKPAGTPQVTPATIQDDLHRRDFTVNAIALSLNRASRGLLLDPMNGLADLGRKELRTLYPAALRESCPWLVGPADGSEFLANDRRRRESHDFGHFVDGEPAEVPQLHDPSLLGVEGCETLQRLIQRQDVHSVRAGRQLVFN